MRLSEVAPTRRIGLVHGRGALGTLGPVARVVCILMSLEVLLVRALHAASALVFPYRATEQISRLNEGGKNQNLHRLDTTMLTHPWLLASRPLVPETLRFLSQAECQSRVPRRKEEE